MQPSCPCSQCPDPPTSRIWNFRQFMASSLFWQTMNWKQIPCAFSVPRSRNERQVLIRGQTIWLSARYNTNPFLEPKVSGVSRQGIQEENHHTTPEKTLDQAWYLKALEELWGTTLSLFFHHKMVLSMTSDKTKEGMERGWKFQYKPPGMVQTFPEPVFLGLTHKGKE